MHQDFDLLPCQIEDLQLHASWFAQPIAERRTRIERIGVVRLQAGGDGQPEVLRCQGDQLIPLSGLEVIGEQEEVREVDPAAAAMQAFGKLSAFGE